MSQMRAEESAIIDAPAQAVYNVIADYRVGHPAILPKQYFHDLVVEKGGTGAGTVIRFSMRVGGVDRSYKGHITEPVPGRVLVESDPDAGTVTTFTVDPLGNGNQARVTIVTEARAARGVAGLIEKLVSPPVMRKIYRHELALLAEYLRAPHTAT